MRPPPFGPKAAGGVAKNIKEALAGTLNVPASAPLNQHNRAFGREVLARIQTAARPLRRAYAALYIAARRDRDFGRHQP